MIKDKTVFIAHNWSDVSVSQQSKALAIQLSENNKVYFLGAKKQGLNKVAVNKNLLLFEWPGKRPTGIRDFNFAIKMMWRYKPDIIVTNFAANDIMLFASWLFGIKTRICYYHTMVEQYIADHEKLSWKQRINIFRKGVVFRMATHMLPVSTAAKKDLLKYYGVNENKVHVFANTLPDKGYINSSNNKLIGFIGRWDHSKGLDILIDAFKKVVDIIPEARLVIAGKGERGKKIQQQIIHLQLEDKIIIKGLIPYTEVFDFLTSLNFLVVPSRTDNLPTVILEAFSTATTVIASDSGGIPDIIIPGYNGYLFEKENADDLSEKIINLLLNIQTKNILAQNARKTFEEKYSIDQLLSRFENMLAAT